MIRRPTPRIFPSAAALALALLAGACASVPPQPAPGAPVRIPGHMTAEGIFVAEPVMASGERLRFHTNSGSGPALIYPDVADRLGMREDSVRVETAVPEKREIWVRRVPMPAFRPYASIPAPLVDDHAGHLIVSPRHREDEPGMDGYLGNPWFAMRTWTFDYARGELLLRAPGDLPSAPDAHRVRLGFQTRDGRRVAWLPRIRVEIGGESVDLLLSTGSDETVSEAALREMGVSGTSPQPLSSVSDDVLERWRERHPEWRVVEDAVDGLYAVIEVPAVSVGGHTVGPVWFAGSGAGAEWLSNWTDLPVEGFLGANVLRFFRLTVDLDQGIAVFERR